MSKAMEMQKAGVVQFFWREDGARFRVWRSDWASDQFETVGQAEFDAILKFATQFGFEFNEAED